MNIIHFFFQPASRVESGCRADLTESPTYSGLGRAEDERTRWSAGMPCTACALRTWRAVNERAICSVKLPLHISPVVAHVQQVELAELIELVSLFILHPQDLSDPSGYAAAHRPAFTPQRDPACQAPPAPRPFLAIPAAPS